MSEITCRGSYLFTGMKLHVLAVVIIVLSCAQEVSSRRRGGYNRRLLKAKIEELKAITTELKDGVNECKAEI